MLLSGCATYRTILPEISETPRDGLTLKIPVAIAVLDGRGDKTDSEQITRTLQEDLSKVYGKSIEYVGFFAKAKADQVFIRIRIITLGANFGSRIVSSISIANSIEKASAVATSSWGTVIASGNSTQNIFASSFSGEGWWIGTAWIELDIQDNRNQQNISFTLPIVAETKESNMFGYASATSAAENAWKMVSAQMIRTLDNILIKIRDEEN
ncbi:MAG: hypothetical protein Q8K92_09170 [Leadbetterella sp.]|nr:hypothetical protein [Leadbetterella sp.]